MMKKVKFLSVGLCLALALTACGAKKDDTKTSVSLGTYKGVEVNVTPVEVTDDDIQFQIDNLLKQFPNFIEYTDRTDVKDGDIAVIDYVGKVDGKEFAGGSAKDQKLTIGSGRFIDDFEEQLIGHNVGETVEVDVTFPEDYKSTELAGKDAIFTVDINGIGYEEAAEFNDEFVKANTDYETVDSYKQYLKEALLNDAQAASDTQKEIDLISAIIEDATFNNLSQEEIDSTEKEMNSYYESMATNMGMDYSLFKYYYFGMDEDTFASEIKKAADLQVKQKYVLEAIIKAEKLNFTDDEYSKYLAEYATTYKFDTPEAFEKAYGKESIENTILLDKAMEFIKENAVYVETAPEVSEETNAAE